MRPEPISGIIVATVGIERSEDALRGTSAPRINPVNLLGRVLNIPISVLRVIVYAREIVYRDR
jgi:hypothetical protein